jgi:hypothetical protein
MPSLTPAELQEARKRSGRLGGRPRKPTVEEARQAALEELTPKALKVLKAHLGEGDEVNPHAWRAALRVFEHAYGRAPSDRSTGRPPARPRANCGSVVGADASAGREVLRRAQQERRRRPGSDDRLRSDIDLTRRREACAHRGLERPPTMHVGGPTPSPSDGRVTLGPHFGRRPRTAPGCRSGG